MENKTGMRVKKLQFDNGREYEDFEFKKFYYENRIQLEKIVSGAPQHNGIVEQMNKTLIKRGRSIHLHEGLPK